MPTAAAAYSSMSAPCRASATSSSLKLVNDIEQRRLLWNIEDRELSRISAVSILLASSDEYYEAFMWDCGELSQKEDPLAMTYFSPATLYKISLYEACRDGLPALSTRLLLGLQRSFCSYRTELYNAAPTLLAKVKSADTAANCTLRDILKTQVPVSGSDETVAVQYFIAAATPTFRFSEKHQKGRKSPSATSPLLCRQRNR